MAATREKATPCCAAIKPSPAKAAAGEWIAPAEPKRSPAASTKTMPSLIEPVEDIKYPVAAKPSAKAQAIPMTMRAQTRHPLDPLSAAEIAVAVSTVRAAGATPEVRDSMRFVEVVLLEPEKNIVALADAYSFPPFQPSLLPRTKGGPVIPSKFPPRDRIPSS